MNNSIPDNRINCIQWHPKSEVLGYLSFRQRMICYAFSLLFLMFGISIYLFYRVIPPILISLCNYLDIYNIVLLIRSHTIGTITNYFILYNGPDLLWSVSFLTAVYALSYKYSESERIILALPLFLTSCITEILQGLDILPGTFDLGDLFSYIVSFLIYNILIFKHTHETAM